MPTSKNISGLRNRIINGVYWTLGGHAVRQALRLATNLIMTRLLMPEMFGVMAIASMFMMALAFFSDLGIRQNVVQSPRGSDPNFLNTAWVMQIGRGALIAGLAMALALVIALVDRMEVIPRDSVYAAAVLPYVVASLGMGALISGFDSTKALEASRRMVLGRLTQIDGVSQLVSIAMMLLSSTFERSIWVLVIGSLTGNITRMILSHIWLQGTNNHFFIERKAFLEIFHFGKWIFLSSFLGFFASASDNLIIGLLVNASTLGIYSISILLLNAFEQIIMKLTGDVAFPALSEVARNRPTDLGKTLYKFHLPTAAFSYGAAGLLTSAAPTIVDLLYDSRYTDAGWMLQVLAVALIAVPCRLHSSCLLALGKPRYSVFQSSIELCAILVAVPTGFYLAGMSGVVWGVVIKYFASVPFTLFFLSRQGLLNIRRELLPLPIFGVAWLLGHLFTRLIAVVFPY